MKKFFRFYLLVWAALLVVYNLVVFFARPLEGFVINYDVRFWVAWGSIIAAFLGQLVCAFTAFKAENKDKLFLNISIITQGYYSLIFVGLAGSIVMLIPDCPYWVSIIVCALSLGVGIVSILSASTAAEIISDVDDKVSSQISFIKSLTVEVENLMSRQINAEIKSATKKVYEAVRYSDPMSNDAVSDIEAEISAKFSCFSNAVTNNDTDAALTFSDDLLALLSERNGKCKLSK